MNFLITGRYKINNYKPLFYLDVGWKFFFKKIDSKYKLYNASKSNISISKFDCLIISGGGDIYKISKKKI